MNMASLLVTGQQEMADECNANSEEEYSSTIMLSGNQSSAAYGVRVYRLLLDGSRSEHMLQVRQLSVF
ncbi:Hypothetical predicted protein [Octopus vulgaris]|uniref:Uncharacterized protein n=1 Tax=Octopus vulgaris TaxID=6645 RepID=A0AA36BHJ8_OCTVU|nr:Hypothetical predicted protein [Octopus vulgaris]